MKSQVVNIKMTDPACMGFDDVFLFVSTQKEHPDFSELRDFAMSYMRSNTNGYWAINLDSIKEITVHDKESEFFINYETKEGKPKKFYFSIADHATRKAFCESLSSVCGLTSRQEIANPFLKLAPNIGLIILTTLLTWVASNIATSHNDTSRKVLARAAGNILKMLGPTIVWLIGACVALYFVYKVIRTYFQPGKTIKYT